MTLIKYFFSVIAFLGFGLLSSGGVFTVFVTVGLVPRFADKTHTADAIIRYENSIVLGSILGCLFTTFPGFFQQMFAALGRSFPLFMEIGMQGFIGAFGLFSGIFVGCIAIAIAEMLNTIPIFVRRVNMGKGLGFIVFAMAIGKTIGSLLYFG